MATPLVVYGAIASELIPLSVAAARARRLTPGGRWVGIWCALYVVQNAITIPLALTRHNNHVFTYIFVPIQGAAILWALSLWQQQQIARLTIRAAIPAFLVAWLLLLLVENTGNFSTIAEPVYSLLALGAALYTLVARGAATSDPLLRQDWFWICIGLSLHFGALALLTPLGAALVKEHPEVVVRAYVLRSWINIVAYVLIAIGLLCPLPSAPSGPSFSPASSA